MIASSRKQTDASGVAAPPSIIADTPPNIAFPGVLDRKEGSAGSSCYV